MAASICRRCGRIWVESTVHEDLYHPAVRPKKTDPLAPSGPPDLEPPPQPADDHCSADVDCDGQTA